MKIGILTYHRSDNFGALFQAIASRYYLESLGHKVYYINYWPNYHRAMYSPFSWWLFWKKRPRGKFNYLITSLKDFSKNIERRRKYSSFVKEYMEYYYAPNGMVFDAIIYGSDQIWRKQPYINDYNPVYFAHNKYQAKCHIALSASAGILPKTEEEIIRFRSLLGNFDKISVREDSLKKMVESFGFNAQLTCDPALFLTADQWNSIFSTCEKKHSKYLLLVNYIEGSFDYEAVKELARVKGLEYVCINGSAVQNPESGTLSNVAPLDFFEYIKNAEFVCSSSFHALVFALIFHKQVLSSFYENAKRAESLLKELGLEERIIPPHTAIQHDLRPIEYKTIDEKIELLRKDAFDYIISSLKGMGDERK